VKKEIDKKKVNRSFDGEGGGIVIGGVGVMK